MSLDIPDSSRRNRNAQDTAGLSHSGRLTLARLRRGHSQSIPGRCRTAPNRRTYDHRIRDLVSEKRDPPLFVQVGIPLSTAASWIRRDSRPVVRAARSCTEIAEGARRG